MVKPLHPLLGNYLWYLAQAVKNVHPCLGNAVTMVLLCHAVVQASSASRRTVSLVCLHPNDERNASQLFLPPNCTIVIYLTVIKLVHLSILVDHSFVLQVSASPLSVPQEMWRVWDGMEKSLLAVRSWLDRNEYFGA